MTLILRPVYLVPQRPGVFSEVKESYYGPMCPLAALRRCYYPENVRLVIPAKAGIQAGGGPPEAGCTLTLDSGSGAGMTFSPFVVPRCHRGVASSFEPFGPEV